MYRPEVIGLVPTDEGFNAVYPNGKVVELRPGDTLRLRVNGQDLTWYFSTDKPMNIRDVSIKALIKDRISLLFGRSRFLLYYKPRYHIKRWAKTIWLRMQGIKDVDGYEYFMACQKEMDEIDETEGDEDANLSA